MNEQQGFDVEDLSVGMSATYGKTVTEADIVLFAGVSGDNNAVHTNQEFAATTAFGGRIAHGMLAASFISAALGTRMPGPGTIYMGQQLNFRAPVRPGETVNATVTVKSIDLKKARVVLETVCQVGSTVVIDGEAVVMVTSSVRRMAKANASAIAAASVTPSLSHNSPA
jgi:3-hydroxybutyryl-CoA dehydratase